MFGLVGPDGAGKTTTIRMLCGILAPTNGGAMILGKNIVTNLTWSRRTSGTCRRSSLCTGI